MDLFSRLLTLRKFDDVSLLQTVTVSESAFTELTTFGSEGIFYPTTVSSPVAQYVILDLEFIRDHLLDFDKPAFTTWCLQYLLLSAQDLQPLSYLFVIGSNDIESVE